MADEHLLIRHSLFKAHVLWIVLAYPNATISESLYGTIME